MVMCSETSPPRLSFSHDLSELEVSPLNCDVPRRDTLLMESNSEFEFSISSSSHEFESSSADELFSNGVIIPTQIQKKPTTRRHTLLGEPPYTRLPPRPCSSSVEKTKKDNNIKEAPSRSFWGFGRSKSLNCDTKKSLNFSCSLLPRSNSTGLVPSPKRPNSKDSTKSFGGSSLYPVQKSASGKGYGGSYANGSWVSPVLNVPTPYISKGTASLFSFGSFLRAGKDKKSKN